MTTQAARHTYTTLHSHTGTHRLCRHHFFAVAFFLAEGAFLVDGLAVEGAEDFLIVLAGRPTLPPLFFLIVFTSFSDAAFFVVLVDFCAIKKVRTYRYRPIE